MQKNFDIWSSLKKNINAKRSRPPFKEREIWWCSLGSNIGDEEDGKGELFLRPVIIIKKFSNRAFVGLPLSSKIKEKHRFYHKFELKGEEQSVIISQIKILDAKRLVRIKGTVNDSTFIEIKKKTKNLIFQVG